MSYSGKYNKIKRGVRSDRAGYGAASFFRFCGPRNSLLPIFFPKENIEIRTSHIDGYEEEAFVNA